MTNIQMEFPETWEEYEQEYGFNDTEEVYTNNSRLIPSFRAKQWLDHLEQEPCEDAISRQAVLKYIEESEADLWHDSENELVRQDIKEFPSVTPQPKTGRWTADKKCSRCGCSSMLKLCIENYCANCGAKMEEAQNADR